MHYRAHILPVSAARRAALTPHLIAEIFERFINTERIDRIDGRRWLSSGNSMTQFGAFSGIREPPSG